MNWTLNDIVMTSYFQQSQRPVGHRHPSEMQIKLPGLIMNQMEKTFAIVQRAFNLCEETMVVPPSRPPLADNEFRQFLDAVGNVKYPDKLRKVIFFGGVEPSLRRVVWKHILNVYPKGLNGYQRMTFVRRKAELYYNLRDTWKKALNQGCGISELVYLANMVRKDVRRTDRMHQFYAGRDDNQNIEALFNVLMTYALNHPSVSYCQGMSDIASPLLVTMNDEAQAYICFCALMRRLSSNFLLDSIAMTQKFAHLSLALNYYDPEFWQYLKLQQADDLLFCYRWLLLEMKREFPFEDALRMLEVQWSSLNYELNNGTELELYERRYVPHSMIDDHVELSKEVQIGSNATSPRNAHPMEENSNNRSMAKMKEDVIRQSSKQTKELPENYYIEKCNNCRLNPNKSFNSIIFTCTCKVNDDDASHSLYLSEGLNGNGNGNDNGNDNDNDSVNVNRNYLNTMNIYNSFDDGTFYKSDTNSDYEPSTHNGQPAIFEASDQTDFVWEIHDTNPFKEDIYGSSKIIHAAEGLSKSFPSYSLTNLHLRIDRADILPRARDLRFFLDNIDASSNHSDGSLVLARNFNRFQHKWNNYNTLSNIIAKQLAQKTGVTVSEGLRRVTSISSSHFRDFKERISASRKGSIVDIYNEVAASMSSSATALESDAEGYESRNCIEEESKLFPLNDTDSTCSLPPIKLNFSTNPSMMSSIDYMFGDLPATTNRIYQLTQTTPAKLPLKEDNVSSETLKDLEQNNLQNLSLSSMSQHLHTENNHTHHLRTTTDCIVVKDGAMRCPLRDNYTENLGRIFDSTNHVNYKFNENNSYIRSDLSANQQQQQQQQRRQTHCKASFTGANANVTTTNPFLDPSHLNNFNGGSYLFFPEIVMPMSADIPRNSHDINIEFAVTATEDDDAVTRTTYTTESSHYSQCPIDSTMVDVTPSHRTLPLPGEFGGGNPFLIFLCLTLLLQHRDTIMKSSMDYNEMAMHFDKLVRKHNLPTVLHQARHMYIEYLQMQQFQS